MSKRKIHILFALVLSFVCSVVCAATLSGCAAIAPSDFAGTDFAFLADFAYGDTNGGEAVITFDTAEDFAASTDEKLTEGSYVKTRGYYFTDDRGGAKYIIEKSGTHGSILLKNGLYANIVIDTCEVDGENFNLLSVKQFGAKSDGYTADHNAIKASVDYINEKLGGRKTVLYFPKGSYRVNEELIIDGLQNVVVTGAIDETEVFSDNKFAGESNYFIALKNVKNCFVGNIGFEAREDIANYGYTGQLTLVDCNNIYLYNLSFNVPATSAPAEEDADNLHVNLSLYSGDKNIIVDSCTMYQMNGASRGANISVTDVEQHTTQNITVTNCEFHGNAGASQVEITSLSASTKSCVKNIKFTNNKIYSHSTAYREVTGAGTTCFVVAENDNDISKINIENNEFVSYADLDFMTFGSVKSCTVKNNKITVYANNGNAGCVFSSSGTNDGYITIQSNEIYLSRTSDVSDGKNISSGCLTFKNNTVMADCTVYKIADRLGVFTENSFRIFGAFGSCGAPLKFSKNTVNSYGQHANADSAILVNYSADDEITANASLEFSNNTINDYAYYYGSKKTDPAETLCAVNGISAKKLQITNNVYNCPNYSYVNEGDYMLICSVNGASVGSFVCKGNDLQGASEVLGASVGSNKLREFNTDISLPQNSAITVLLDGEAKKTVITEETTVTLTTETEEAVEWFALDNGVATLENGVIKGKSGGTFTVYVIRTDGSGIYTKISVTIAPEKPNIAAAVFIIIAVLWLATAAVGLTVALLKRKHGGSI